jgi:sulfoxide reductase catalytic subunit YedY
MLIKKNPFKSKPVPSSEITPEQVYLNRRDFMKAAGAFGAGALLLAACGDQGTTAPTNEAGTPMPTPTQLAPGETTAATDELGDPLTSFENITNYNNFYEFSLDKENVAPLSKNFKTSPWQVEVYGLVNNPITYTMEDILSKFTQEERIYRLRCVEGWSMVIPWMGFPISSLLAEVEPTAEAKYLRFETVWDPTMPNINSRSFPFPYNEGLRMDEAMHNLAILATGLYGKPLPPQDGAPIRLIVPWKYGFKSVKSIVKIELVAEQPATLWNRVAPHEYGFYANVNPNVAHPRWSQATERRIGELNRRDTLMFNGYEADVAGLYAGMDLAENY